MVREPTSVRWRGRNGYGQARTTTTIASSAAYVVLVRNRLETRSMFAITRRPCATTSGRVAKRLSRRTSRATALVAPAADPIAMPRSASLSARASFTPSPVIATVCPSRWRALTMDRFCSGVTRPKAESSRNAAARASSDSSSAPEGRSRASTPRTVASPSSRTTRAIAPTVRALSPEMTLTRTPCSLK